MDREQLTANAATHANASLTAQTVYGARGSGLRDSLIFAVTYGW